MPIEQIPHLEHNPGGREVEPDIGLSPDAINAWNNLGMISQVDDTPMGRIAEKAVKRSLTVPMPTYIEYLEAKYPDRAERLLTASDPKAVARLDELVTEFNQQREAILVAADWKEQVASFWQRAERLLLGK